MPNEQGALSEDNQKQAALIPYLAGIVDGEGWITMRRNKGGGQYAFEIGVGMVSEHIIDLLVDTFGGRKYEERVPNRRSIYRWKIQNQAGLKSCIQMLRPYLRVKHRQADTVMHEMTTRCVRLNSDAPRKLSIEELQRREEVYQKMRKFNAVGAAATTNRENTCEGEVIV